VRIALIASLPVISGICKSINVISGRGFLSILFNTLPPIGGAQIAVQNAIGGETVTEIVDSRARYPVNVRYRRDFRSDTDSLKQVLVSGEGGTQVPLGQLASVQARRGPAMIRDENGLLTGYVYIDVGDEDARRYQQRVAPRLASVLEMPQGYAMSWSGQYEALERMHRRLQGILPATLLLVVLLIHLNTASWVKTGIILLSVPFSAIGAIWAIYLLGYRMSTAVGTGVIALLGVDAQTGVFMLLYLDLAYAAARESGRLRNVADLRQVVLDGAAKPIWPKFMTVATMTIGLVPILWSTGAGADLMKRIAAPMVGGLATSFLMELLVYPVLYMLWRRREISLDVAPHSDFAEHNSPSEVCV
jgi:copper/silver efflux system protein